MAIFFVYVGRETILETPLNTVILRPFDSHSCIKPAWTHEMVLLGNWNGILVRISNFHVLCPVFARINEMIVESN